MEESHSPGGSRAEAEGEAPVKKLDGVWALTP
jgi:hypothetical protein